MLGDGAGSSTSQIPTYGTQANVANITGAGVTTVRDPAAKSQCRF